MSSISTPPSWGVHEKEKGTPKLAEIRCCGGSLRRPGWATTYWATPQKALEYVRRLEKKGYKRGEDCEHYRNAMLFNLVRATPEDMSEYIRIGKLCISQYNTVSTRTSEVLKEIVGSTVYMIHAEDAVVGFVSYTRFAESAYISEVQIVPEYRNRGIGGRALMKVLEELKHVPTVDLHTHPENPAQHLYGRLGFKPTGEVIENYHETGQPRMRMLLHHE